MKIGKTKSYHPVLRVLFLISFILSFLYLFRSSGRLELITFLFAFVLAEANLKGRIPVLSVSILIGIAGFITLFGKSLFSIFLYDFALDNNYARYEDTNFLFPILDFLGEFSFPFLDLTTNLSLNVHWLWFEDVIFSFTYALPAVLFPMVESTSMYNTWNVLGPTETIPSVPADILSYGYLNLGILGLLLMPILFGFVCKWSDSFKKSMNNPLSVIFSIALSFIIGFRIMYFDPKHLIKGSFYFFFVLVIILISLKFQKRYRFN